MKMRDLAQLISTFLVVTFLGGAALLTVSSASAQSTTTGSIEGILTDPQGAAVPGVTVMVTPQTGRSESATSNDEGFFRILNLQPGQYTLRVEAGKGFAAFEQANVEVNLSRTTNVNAQLRPAGAAETVTVTSGSGAAADKTAPTTAENSGQVTTNGGLTTVTFETRPGTVRVILPDDMMAGDTISGTVVAEPKGQTPEERKTNMLPLAGRKIIITTGKKPDGTPDVTVEVPVTATPGPLMFVLPKPKVSESRPPYVGVGLQGLGVINVLTRGGKNEFEPSVRHDFESPNWEAKDGWVLPKIGQQGRTIEIVGPFDGNAANTNCQVGGRDVNMLAESPRKLVFESPSDILGLTEISVKEGNVETKGEFRNVGVNLSAPKTNLLKGEKTTLTVQVSGLEGIKEPVPLTLECKGVITMEGGIYQPLIIQPSQVGADGRYTTTRGMTGVQTGGWEATATVVTGRFNVWLQDDSDPNRIFHFNSFTGEYIFACGGGSCRGSGSTGGTQTGGTTGKPGGTTPPGGTDTPPITPTGTPLTGTGKPVMKGCIITLSHNAPDRRVFAKLDACTKTGDASVETKSPKANFNITDKNTTDNKVASPPK